MTNKALSYCLFDNGIVIEKIILIAGNDVETYVSRELEDFISDVSSDDLNEIFNTDQFSDFTYSDDQTFDEVQEYVLNKMWALGKCGFLVLLSWTDQHSRRQKWVYTEALDYDFYYSTIDKTITR